MKKPHNKMSPPVGAKGAHGTKERPQGGAKRASGVNKPVEKASIPQVVATNKIGSPTQRQKM